MVDQHNYLKGHEHTGIVIGDISKNMQIYFMFQIKPGNCSNSNHTKGLGYLPQLRDSVITTLRKITRDINSLIGPIIERYEVFLLPVVKKSPSSSIFPVVFNYKFNTLCITQHFYYRYWNICLAISVFMICNSYLKFSSI
jgi:hypothetical protein